jgi:serine/threonine protein kinase
MVTGTPAYLAPEVARGARADAAADVFSLGATLYAALEGSPPFGTAESPMALLHRVAGGQVNPPRRSGPLAPLLMRMLAANPADRPSMVDVSRTLSALQADLGAARNTTQLIPPAAAVPAGLAAGLAAAPLHPTAELPAVPGTAAPEAVLPAAVLPGSVVPPVGPGVRPMARPPRRGRAGLIAALVTTVLIVGLVVALLLIGNNNTGGNNNGPQAGQQTTSSAPPSTRDSTPVTSPTESSTPSASPTDQQSSGNGNGNGNGNAPTADQLAQAITDYYDLLPDNTDEAWDRLTKRYQHGTARNREYFQSFWDQMASVDTSNVTGTAPDSVKATITYTYKDGKVVVERTAFTLVREGDILKIDSSEVLDSQTQ